MRFRFSFWYYRGWWFQTYFLDFFHPEIGEDEPILTDISSNGLKPLVAEIICSPPERMFWLTKNADDLAGDAWIEAGCIGQDFWIYFCVCVTPQKFNLDTKNGHTFEKASPFPKYNFWVSILVFGGVPI